MKLKFLLDTLVLLVATPLAYITRFDGVIAEQWYVSLLVATFGMFIIKLTALWWTKLYRQTWHTITLRDLEVLLKMIASVFLIYSAVAFVLRPNIIIPRSIPFLDALYSIFLLASMRALSRYVHEGRLAQAVAVSKRVLIVGAGDAGSLIAREMLRHPETGMRPVGFLDDDPNKQHSKVVSVPVLGTLQDIHSLLASHRVDEVLIALPSAEGRIVRDLINRATHTGNETPVTYRTIPALHELISGEVSINRIRNVDVEDLLRRAPVRLDLSDIAAYLEGRVVLVTGAGGSIGSELVRQICRFKPAKLLLLGRGETSIYHIAKELDRSWPDIAYKRIIANIREKARLEAVFAEHHPQVVFHAAAHKHVTLMEENPEEAVLNNVLGSKNLVEVALTAGVTHFVNISTDKAVNPTSVMGASKRLAEFIVKQASERASHEQTFVSVRFGNVLGSRGSVVPLFKQQIHQGGPLTVTHPDMERYFMTIPEASQLVLQAASQGENGKIYILDMGEPVKIVDLAKDLIRLSGLEPNQDIDIIYTGIQPGEKLYEELTSSAERDSDTTHNKIFIAKFPSLDASELEMTLERLKHAALANQHHDIRKQLLEFANLSHQVAQV
ncbi:MAG: nucleoside-diphosphate sugar epimerase/dehydratase [Deinococcota bacterium]